MEVAKYPPLATDTNNNNNNNDNDNDNDNDNNNNNNNFLKIMKKNLLTTMLSIKILFTFNSLEKKNNYSFKTLFPPIPVDLKST